MTRVAVIGAGLSGLVVARRLKETAEVKLFEKSRGPGGRIATRYGGEFEFDHGAQFFTARTAEFREFLRPLIADGAVANWMPQFAELERARITDLRSWDEEYPHYVGAPRMNRLGKVLSDGLDVAYETAVSRIERQVEGWTLFDERSRILGDFDWLVVTAPAAQTAALAAEHPELIALCAGRKMLSCFAVMLGFGQQQELPWQAALVRGADISWISVNSSKPGRKEPFTLVIHSTNAWASAHIDDDLDRVRDHLLSEASAVTGLDLGSADHCQLHRWRYANIVRQDGPAFYIDGKAKLAACGDWFVRGRIEAAFTSANDLSSELRQRI